MIPCGTHEHPLEKLKMRVSETLKAKIAETGIHSTYPVP
jgi:hypothetical protein